jgi:hypothetical protein
MARNLTLSISQNNIENTDYNVKTLEEGVEALKYGYWHNLCLDSQSEEVCLNILSWLEENKIYMPINVNVLENNVEAANKIIKKVREVYNK